MKGLTKHTSAEILELIVDAENAKGTSRLHALGAKRSGALGELNRIRAAADYDLETAGARTRAAREQGDDYELLGCEHREHLAGRRLVEAEQRLATATAVFVDRAKVVLAEVDEKIVRLSARLVRREPDAEVRRLLGSKISKREKLDPPDWVKVDQLRSVTEDRHRRAA